MNFRKMSVLFDFEPEFLEILVEWNAPSISGGTTGSLVDLELFKLASLASTMEAIIADNWSGTCGAVFVAGESLSWRRVIKTGRGPVWFRWRCDSIKRRVSVGMAV